MAIKSGFFNAQMDVNNQPDRVYSAEDMSRFFVGLFTDGVFNNIGDRFEVKENATDRTYVKTGTGKAWYNGMWFISDDSDEKIQVLAAEQSVNRIDALCIHFNYSLRKVYFDWIKGTAASNGNASPSKPTISPGYMPIAYITRRAQSSGVTNTDIELTVGVDPKSPLVANAIARELNYSSYYTTFQNTFNNYLQGNKDAWNSWFGSTATAAGSVRKAWTDWFGSSATASNSVRKAWTDWFGSSATASNSVRKAWTDWFGSSATASGSIRKTWSDYLSTCDGEWSDFKTEKANDYSLVESNITSNWTNFLRDRQSEWQSWFGSTATASGSVRKAWTDWFGASDSAGIKKTFWDWFGTSNSAGIKKTFWDWLGTDNTKGIKKSFWDWFGTSSSYGIKKEWETWKQGIAGEYSDIFYDWFGRSDSAGIRKTFYDWFNKSGTGVVSVWNTWFQQVQEDLTGAENPMIQFEGHLTYIDKQLASDTIKNHVNMFVMSDLWIESNDYKTNTIGGNDSHLVTAANQSTLINLGIRGIIKSLVNNQDYILSFKYTSSNAYAKVIINNTDAGSITYEGTNHTVNQTLSKSTSEKTISIQFTYTGKQTYVYFFADKPNGSGGDLYVSEVMIRSLYDTDATYKEFAETNVELTNSMTNISGALTRNENKTNQAYYTMKKYLSVRAITKTLSTSQTTDFVFTNADANGQDFLSKGAPELIDVYSSIYGVNPISVVVNKIGSTEYVSSITVTFPKYTSAASLTCVITRKPFGAEFIDYDRNYSPNNRS